MATTRLKFIRHFVMVPRVLRTGFRSPHSRLTIKYTTVCRLWSSQLWTSLLVHLLNQERLLFSGTSNIIIRFGDTTDDTSIAVRIATKSTLPLPGPLECRTMSELLHSTLP